MLRRPRGLVLVTGPTGSGKTTTLATMIDWINSEPRPAHRDHRGPDRVLPRAQAVASSPSARSAPTCRTSPRRCAACCARIPDVILLGEMRDLETISAAITAAETGHLVLRARCTPRAARAPSTASSTPSRPTSRTRSAPSSRSIEAVISQVLLPRADGGTRRGLRGHADDPRHRNLIRKNETNKIQSTIQTSRAVRDGHAGRLPATTWCRGQI